MKITQRFLRRIISEELEKIIEEGPASMMSMVPKRDDEELDEGPTLGAASYNKRDDDLDDLDEGDNDTWIQAADRDIERRGTKGRCTGAKFGSESCPKGSKEYNLAKTFKKMARDRKKK